jgi:hypothetical protein
MSATAFGSTSGPLYPLGLITVASAGAPVALTANVGATTAFGTGTSQAPVVCNQIKVSAPSANTGDIQLIFKSQAAASGSGTSVIMNIAKGTTQTLQSPQLSNPFMINQMGLDGTHSGDSAWVTLVIL